MSEIQPIENNETWGSIRAKLNQLIASKGGETEFSEIEEVAYPIPHILIVDSEGAVKKVRLIDFIFETTVLAALALVPNDLPISYLQSAVGKYNLDYLRNNMKTFLENRGYINPPELTNVSTENPPDSSLYGTVYISATIDNPDDWDPDKIITLAEKDGKAIRGSVSSASISGDTLSVTASFSSYLAGSEYELRICWYDLSICVATANHIFPLNAVIDEIV